MEKGNKMYSTEIVDKAISTTAIGFTCSSSSFEKNVKELPEEVQCMVLAAVTAGHFVSRLIQSAKISKISEIKEKLEKMENPTREDFDKLFKEAFTEGKQSLLPN